MNNSLPETIALMSGANVISDTQAQQDFVAAIQLLKNDALRTFRIEIETDSTIAVNENVEKQSRIEFLSAISQFLPQALSTFQQIPQLGQAMAEMLLFGVRGFRAGRGWNLLLSRELIKFYKWRHSNSSSIKCNRCSRCKTQSSRHPTRRWLRSKANCSLSKLNLI